MAAYFAALDPMTLVRALPGNVAQGIIWGIMALGVYITFRILDFADLTVDGSLAVSYTHLDVYKRQPSHL